MKENSKPLPVTQPWSKKFWEGAKDGRLLIQKCNQCGSNIFYPRNACPECWSKDLGWIESSGRGKIYTYTVTIAGVEKKFAADLPYVLAYINLDEGIRMMTRIVGCDPDQVNIGMDVEVVFEELNEEFSLPYFKPVSA